MIWKNRLYRIYVVEKNGDGVEQVCKSFFVQYLLGRCSRLGGLASNGGSIEYFVPPLISNIQ